MVPDVDRNAHDAELTRIWVWVNGRQFLKVCHAANIRMGSPISKIWLSGPNATGLNDDIMSPWSV